MEYMYEAICGTCTHSVYLYLANFVQLGLLLAVNSTGLDGLTFFALKIIFIAYNKICLPIYRKYIEAF